MPVAKANSGEVWTLVPNSVLSDKAQTNQTSDSDWNLRLEHFRLGSRYIETPFRGNTCFLGCFLIAGRDC